MLDLQWLAGWAAKLDAAAVRAMRDIVSAYLPDYDDQKVGPPTIEAVLATVRDRMPWMPEDLFDLYRFVGPASLPDIANGYFVHEPADLVTIVNGHGRVDRIGKPLEEHEDIVVFGSDGGGALFALASGGRGPVYRLREAAYVGGVYSGHSASVTVVAADLRDFLEKLLGAVEAFRQRRQCHRSLSRHC